MQKYIGWMTAVFVSIMVLLPGMVLAKSEAKTISLDDNQSKKLVLQQEPTMGNDTSTAVGTAKINLVWQPTFEAVNNLASLDKVPGMNVIAPSWFSIVGTNGFIKNCADESYVANAHAKGYKVWALITNSFDPDLTSAVLHDPKARQYVVNQLQFFIEKYNLDGINLDFENIYDEDKDALTAFVREIKTALEQTGTIVSMDITVPSETSRWSTCYNRQALGETVDYVMLMAYDEHWRTSPVSGSVASIGWVETGIINTLKSVPAHKLILGIPFYMRKWEENNGKVTAKTLTMDAAENLIREKQLQPQWMADQGQYYFEYEEDGKLYRVWQEDARSIALKVGLADKYQLPGVAAWRKGFEKPEIWAVIDKSLNMKSVLKEKNVLAGPKAEALQLNQNDNKRSHEQIVQSAKKKIQTQ
ncbi:glycosyl hydrolase family 18 protein [Propionispira raffinosivorans]|uniref:glycosyl hydrolase family 18 protein n=1 Tax=Propionispira raffinosivorans TaxID=86959 RepID=UPI0003709820|nr:glycosyl hydrolase family 18 protein [Propionispira raffinosivorans]